MFTRPEGNGKPELRKAVRGYQPEPNIKLEDSTTEAPKRPEI